MTATEKRTAGGDNLDAALGSIPDGLRLPLIREYEALLSEYRAGRWESVGLKAGKLCEIVYTILDGHLRGSFAAAPSKPKNMVAACQALEQMGAASASRSVRIQMPRLLIAIYELRNNRAIGHVGGDVDPNHMDAELFLRSAKWLIAELVRVFSSMTLEAASALVESVTEKNIPVLWEGAGVKRVLNANLSAKDKIMALAYSSPKGVTCKDLGAWSGYSNVSRLRSGILGDLNKQALIHFDPQTDTVTILPTGVRYVERSGILKLPD